MTVFDQGGKSGLMVARFCAASINFYVRMSTENIARRGANRSATFTGSSRIAELGYQESMMRGRPLSP